MMKLQKYYRSNKMNLSEYYSKLEMCRLKYQKLDRGPQIFQKSRKKVKCTLVQALRLCTGCMAHSGSRGIALPLLDHGTRRGWGVSVTPRPLFTPRKDLVPIAQEVGWAPGPVWTGAENLTPTRIRSPDRPARSQSLYQLHYPAQKSRSHLQILGVRRVTGKFPIEDP